MLPIHTRCTVLYCPVLYCAVLCTVLYRTALYYAVVHYIEPHWFVLYHSALYCTVLHCIVMYRAMLCRSALFGSLTVARRYLGGVLGPPWGASGATSEPLWASQGVSLGHSEVPRGPWELLGTPLRITWASKGFLGISLGVPSTLHTHACTYKWMQAVLHAS